MALTQTHFRFRTDANAVDATPTWAADEDASPSPATTPFRLRLGVQGTSAASGEFEIYAQKNSGSYAAVTTSATGGVQSYDASSSADDTALLVPRLTLSSAWWLAGAAIDLDFAGGRYYETTDGKAVTDYLSCSRASDGYAKNLAGNWVQFSSNVLRITDLGLLVEGDRTNYLLQSASPATQTTESLGAGSYTLWVEGTGSALASGGTATITGASSATDGSPNTFSVTVAGTVTVTVTGTLTRFQLELGSFKSSYIPTTTASAARAADVITAVGASSLYTILRGTAGSVVGAFKEYFAIAGSMQQIVTHRTGGPSYIYINGPTTVGFYDDIVGNDASRSISPSSFPDGSPFKVGGSWDSGGRSVTGRGYSVGTSAVALTAAGGANVVSLFQGGGLVGWTFAQRLTVWDSRLADATLQALTAP